MFHIAICDDSLRDGVYLRERIRQHKEYAAGWFIHEYRSGRELLNEMNTIRFSLIFMDIKMARMDGEETAECIRKTDKDVVLVFYTGYAEPSPHSFEMEPYRFIKKNMTESEIDRYIGDALKKMMETAQVPLLAAKCNGRKLYLRPNDIVYIEKCNKTTRAYISMAAREKYHVSAGEEIRIAERLKNLYQILRSYGFGYPHDSYIINFEYLLTFTGNEFTLEGFENTSFKFARSKAVEFRQQMHSFMGLQLQGVKKGARYGI